MKLKYILLYLKINFLFLFKSNELVSQGVDIGLWKKKFIGLLNYDLIKCEELLTEFFTCQIKRISFNKIKLKNKYTPILFCVVKNDISKIKCFITHYRKLGVEVFVFLDNNSDDGTREFLCGQKDTIVYFSDQQYSSLRRVAWLNRLMAIYGCNHWCLIADSDELVTYIGSEKYQFSDMIKKAINNHYCRLEGFLLDMYPDDDIFHGDGLNYINHNKYFDAKCYKLNATQKGIMIKGGPRKRKFRTDVCLSKYPLFFLRTEDMVANSHYMEPPVSAEESPIWLAICHYKFLDKKDLEKVKEAVCNQNYALGSAEYKKYLQEIKKGETICFYEETISCELRNSYSLGKISFLKTPFS